MIQRIGQVMLYVDNQDDIVSFWTKQVGFSVIAESEKDEDFRWIEIAPSKDAETSFVLHNKQVIAAMQPELNLGTPSILLFADNLEELYRDFIAKGVTVGDMVKMPTGEKVFNFADPENNYFAIVEK
jgi:lactoylglutathione lyase